GIEERLTFSFALGTFSCAYRDIPWRGFDDLVDISVLDGAQVPLNYTVSFAPQATGDWHIRWTFPLVTAPAIRTFIVRYTVTNALLQPASALNRLDWQALGTAWSVLTDNLTVHVVLPAVTGRGPTAPGAPLRTRARGGRSPPAAAGRCSGPARDAAESREKRVCRPPGPRRRGRLRAGRKTDRTHRQSTLGGRRAGRMEHGATCVPADAPPGHGLAPKSDRGDSIVRKDAQPIARGPPRRRRPPCREPLPGPPPLRQ